MPRISPEHLMCVKLTFCRQWKGAFSVVENKFHENSHEVYSRGEI